MSRRADVVTGMTDTPAPGVLEEHGSGVGPAFIVKARDCCSLSGQEGVRQLHSVTWPLQSYLELGALPGAVPSARLHARLVLNEWGIQESGETVELIVSELITNAVQVSQGLERSQ